MCEDEAPIAPGEIATPVVTYTEITVRSLDQVTREKETRVVEKADEDGDAAKGSEKRRWLREVDVATAMHEHLLETNPELSDATSFLDAVCGRKFAPTKVKTNEPEISGTGETSATEMPMRAIELSKRARSSSARPSYRE